MRAIILQHADDSPPGTIIDWLDQRRHSYEVRALHLGARLPGMDETDWVILLGGPMNVDETSRYPWLEKEKRFLRDAIKAGKTCLGLCLGGQLLAQALGAEVRRNDRWEIGWFPVQLADGASLTVFHWHEDVFDLPPGAALLAGNSVAPNQAFRAGRNLVGIQFHPEATRSWVEDCATEAHLPAGEFVQNGPLMLAGLRHLSPMREWFFDLLNQLETETGRADKK